MDGIASAGINLPPTVDAPFLPSEEGRLDERPGLGYLMVATAATLFAVNGTVSKVVLGSGLSSLELTQIRSTGAAAGFLLLLLLFSRKRLRVDRRELAFLVLFGVTGVAFVQWLYFAALEHLPVGISQPFSGRSSSRSGGSRGTFSTTASHSRGTSRTARRRCGRSSRSS